MNRGTQPKSGRRACPHASRFTPHLSAAHRHMLAPTTLRDGATASLVLRDLMVAEAVPPEAWRLVCSHEQCDELTTTVMARDINNGQPIALDYATALKDYDGIGIAAVGVLGEADHIPAVPAPQVLGLMTAQQLLLKLRAVQRSATRLADRDDAQAARAAGGPGPNDGIVSAIKAGLGKGEDDLPPMTKPQARELLDTAKASGVRVSTETVLQPGPATLTKARHIAHSARQPADSKTRPRYPTTAMLPPMAADTMSDRHPKPFTTGAGQSVTIGRAFQHKLVAIQIVTAGQATPRGITTRDTASAGELLSPAAHWALCDRVDAVTL